MILKFPKLEPWQQVVYDDAKDAKGTGKVFTVVSKRQIGKTILAVILLITYAIQGKCTSIIVEPTLTQSRRVMKQIVECLNKSGLIKKANESLLEIELTNGSQIIFKSAEQREKLRGFTVSGILVIDEGAFITDDIFEICYPWCDAHKAPMLIISTPLFTDGAFYDWYIKGKSGDPNIYSYNWSEFDTSKYLTPEKLELYRQTLSPNRFKSDYLGEFLTEGSYVFGDLSSCIDGYSKLPSIYCGIDWATGQEDGDYTVVIMLNEYGHVTFVKSLRGLEPTKQIEEISMIIKATPSLKKIQVELNSIGSVYYDFLKKACGRNDIIGFNTTNESKRRIVEQLVSAFQKGTIRIPNNKELIIELQHFAVEKTAKGYTYNGIPPYHDDYVIALSLAYDLTVTNKGTYVVSVFKPKKKVSMIERYG